MALQTMYPGMSNSPKTMLASAITASATSMTVSDSTVLPAAPNIAVIGSNQQAEVVIYSGKNGNNLTGLIRGAGGTTARAWSEDTVVARNFTLLDYENICTNITELNTNKRDKSEAINVGTEVTGTLAIARGGTGAATAAINKVFAGPSSGSTAAPSFRSLVAADIPALAASKITSGTLAIAQGGTGAATAAVNNIFAGPSSGSSAAAPSFRALVAADIPALSADKITSGTLSADRIPSLAASKITSGTFGADRIPDLSAAKITSGTLAIARGGTGAATAAINKVFAGPSSGSTAAPSFRALVAADIPALAASKITSGTFGADRIPALSADKITSGTLSADRIPSLAASKITSGTLAIARGGTGAATAAINKVFAGPSSGSTAAPSFRSLVAADIPTLAYSKISGATAIVQRPNYQISTTDLTDGTSSLANGTLYFVY